MVAAVYLAAFLARDSDFAACPDASLSPLICDSRCTLLLLRGSLLVPPR
jgi:hypothetical protein